MLTPAFELSQEADFLILSIRVPYTRTSEFDLYIDGEDFKFYAKPYFLRLTLPGRIVEDGREKASFDVDKGLFTLRVPKETPGQHFEGLQMLTSLLAPKGSRSAKPLVEDLEACSGSMEREEEEDEDEDENFDWQVDQQVYTEISEEELGGLQKYGFGNLRSGVFTRLQDELSDVIDVKTPDNATAMERRQGRLTAESAKFDPDHYLADLFEDDEVQNLLKFCPWWTKLSQDEAATFTEEEKEQMRKFTNRSYLLDRRSRTHVWLSLLDIILAYAYEVRATEGEHNVESSWNIRKLSGTLCWLETYSSVQEVLVSFGRRVLCYPLHRHFGLVTAAIRDAARIFRAGKACVLKCLLDIHKIFRENDPAYILNDLYITDYCVWIQRVKSRKVTALADPLRKVSLRKADLGLELEELEAAAALVEEEENEGEGPGAARSTPQSHSGEESGSSSSGGDSSEESEDSGTEGQEDLDTAKGGAAAPASAPPRPLISEEPQALEEGGRERGAGPTQQLIQELGERVEAGLTISELPEDMHSRSSGEREADGAGERDSAVASQSNSARTGAVAATATTATTAAPRTFLEVCPRRNPLLIVAAAEDDEDDDWNC
ncbi:protein SHQ1 homolog [Megalops cyprinoides]|uniref:protein SHQ1 homolog n=1 Tax=Megalops cyprinoides TaxID=118141 RepID=UPI001864FCF6|nr:protein SHQ1 homolog [Megalops cyprinoides]